MIEKRQSRSTGSDLIFKSERAAGRVGVHYEDEVEEGRLPVRASRAVLRFRRVCVQDSLNSTGAPLALRYVFAPFRAAELIAIASQSVSPLARYFYKREVLS